MANIFKQPCDDGVIRSAPDCSPCARLLGRWVLIATIIGSSMVFIDGTVVNVALPVLQSELNATVTDVQWVVESYALFLAALILVGGSLGDHFGRRRIFAGGVLLFALASLWCGLAPDTEQLILARSVQGIGGALLVPGSLAIISASFSNKQRGRAIGTWSAFTAVTTALGPLLGGWMIEQLSWRWVFFINIPLAAIVVGILYWRVPESRDDTRTSGLDWWGALLATIGLGGIVYGLIESSLHGFSHPLVLSSLIVGVLGIIAFLFVEVRSGAPMMPLILFRSRTFTGANLVTLLLYSALSGALFFLPFNLIQVQGYTATAAGASFLPFILLIFLLSRWAGGLIDRHGAKLPLTIGPVVAAVGYVLLALPEIGGSYWTTFLPGLIVLGLGMATSVAPLTTVVMSAVEGGRVGIASGINNAAARTAGLMSIAVMGIFALSAFNDGLDSRLATVEIPPEAQQVLDDQRIKLAGAETPAGLDDEASVAVERAIAESFVDSFRLVMLIAAALALGSAVTAYLTIEGKSTVSSHNQN